MKFDFENNYQKMVRKPEQYHQILLISIFMSAYLYSLIVNGPTYLSDESSYLAKAASIAGFQNDMASSWFAGYGLLLAPLFLVLPNADWIWRGIGAVNALLLVGSFYFLERILMIKANKFSRPLRNNSLIFTFLYPSYFVMSSYAFTNTIFIFILSAMLYARVVGENKPSALIFSSFFAGYLYWIHPIGAGIAIGFIVDRGIALKNVSHKLISIISLIICLCLSLLYKFWFHPLINIKMTASGFEQFDHYNGFFNDALSLKFIMGMAIIALGQISYLTIGTHGYLINSIASLAQSTNRKSAFNYLSYFLKSQYLFLIIPLIGTLFSLIITSIAYADFQSKPDDRWIFGRYIELNIFPILPFIYLFSSQVKSVKLPALIITLYAVILLIVIDNQNQYGFDYINIIAFWPAFIFPYLSLPALLAIGLIGIFLVRKFLPRYGMKIMLPFFIWSSLGSANYHMSAHKFTAPSTVVKAIRAAYPKGTCIGFLSNSMETRATDIFEEQSRYSFPLYDYDVRRVTSLGWSSTCKGPLFVRKNTNEPIPFGVQIIARNLKTETRIYFPIAANLDLFIKNIDQREYQIYRQVQ